MLLVVPQMQGTAGAIHGPVLLWSLAFSVAVVVGVTAVGLYQAKQRLRLEGVVVRLGVGLGLAAIFLALVNFFFPLGATGALWAWSFAISLVLLATTRTVFARYADHAAFTRRVLVYGAGKRAARLLKLRRRSDRRGFEIVAFVPAIGDTELVEDPRVRRNAGCLIELAQQLKADEIVVAMDDRRQGFPVAELLECKFGGVSVIDVLGFLERETGKMAIDLGG